MLRLTDVLVHAVVAGMALLCAVAAWTRSRSWAFAAVSILGAIVLGRSLGWISNGGIGSDLIELAIELGLIAALLRLASNSTPALPQAPRIWRPTMVAGALLIIPAAGATALLGPRLQQRIFDSAARQRASTVNRAPL